MRIAVIADTHNRLPLKLPRLLARADEIWHLGDVCEPDCLDDIEYLGPPLRVVRGNNDFHPWPLTLRFEREGLRFHLEHIPPTRAPGECDCVLHGHTHVPRDEELFGMRWLNPGAVSLAHRGAPASFAWLTLEKDRPLRWELVLL
jgi:phosphoesterase, MJ0936 family